MMRWDVLNAFIEKYNYKSFLEIGYFQGWSFDNVRCAEKTAVDPNPLKTEQQRNAPYNTLLSGEGINEDIWKLTSDDFFKMAAVQDHWKMDLIFIDGLHEASQVAKDIENSLKHLSPGGTIVLHDCNPPKYEHTTTGIDGCWTGDTYKAFVKWRLQNPSYDSYTIDTDWGCGVITQDIIYLDWLEYHDRDASKQTQWDYFDNHRKELLNLISVEEFLKKTNERTKDNHLSAQ